MNLFLKIAHSSSRNRQKTRYQPPLPNLLGLEIYELSQDGLNLRWRVRKEDMLYLGETRIEGPDRPRAIVESEFHVSSTQQTETWGEMRKGILDLPKLLSGETRFRVDRQEPESRCRNGSKRSSNPCPSADQTRSADDGLGECAGFDGYTVWIRRERVTAEVALEGR